LTEKPVYDSIEDDDDGFVPETEFDFYPTAPEEYAVKLVFVSFCVSYI
jgi:hypothetical protein